MKKKILSLVLALLMAASSASMIAADEAAAEATAEAAVEAAEAEGESAYASAVEFLHSYGIYKGESADDLAEEEDIERYQMALFVARISTGWVDDDKWEDGPDDRSGFTDINDGEEASKYLGAISYASQKGIIEGYGNGEFGPYDGITYQDALTMAVRTLGYQGLDWPWGYIEKAVELGLTKNITDVAYTDILTRGEVAMVIYNALFAEKNGGSTLARDIFGMSEWTPIVITASDIAVYEKDGKYLPKADEYLPGAEEIAQNKWVGFKIFDPATGYVAEATKDIQYYAEAADLGLDAAKHEDDLAVGSTYWVVFKQDTLGEYADIMEYQSTVIDTLWNKGKTDDEGNAQGYAVNEYLNARTPVSKYTPANFVSNTKFLKPEIMLYHGIDRFHELEVMVDGSKLTIDMETGDILVRCDEADAEYKVDKEDASKLFPEETTVFKGEYYGDKYYKVLWHWNATMGKYFRYEVDAEKGAILGIKWMEEGDLKVEDYLNYIIDPETLKIAIKDEYAETGMDIMSDLPATTAYASLVLEDVDLDGEAERGIYEEYGLGYITDDKAHCDYCGWTTGYTIERVKDVLYNEETGDVNYYMSVGDREGALSTNGTQYAAEYHPLCAHATEDAYKIRYVRPWFAEGYGMTKDGYVIYNYDSETGEIKIVKEIYEKTAEERTDADSYVDYGVLRAYSAEKGKVVIGDTVYTTKYDELKHTGFYKTNDEKYQKLIAEGLDSLLNQYVKFVVVDGEVVAMNLVGVAADAAYLVVKEYAGMTNDGYIAVEAWNASTGKLGVYCIASYNGWKQGDYYYYLTEEKVRESFSAGTLYYIKSYDKNEDVYNVELVGYHNEDGKYIVDNTKASLANTGVTFYKDGYKNVGGVQSAMSDDDVYIILQNRTSNDSDIAPIYVHKGKVTLTPDVDKDNGWRVEGQRITTITGAVVIVNPTVVVGFDLDKHESGMYLYEGGKVVEAAYDSYYSEIFGGSGEFKEGRYILGAVTYKVEALNLYTGVREDIIVDRNIDLTKNHVYVTVSGKVMEEIKPESDNELFLTPANAFWAMMKDRYYTDRNLDVKYASTADYLFGQFEYKVGTAGINDRDRTTTWDTLKYYIRKNILDKVLVTDGWYEYVRERVTDVTWILVDFNENVPGAMYVVNHNDWVNYVKEHKDITDLECHYVYDVDTGKMVVYASRAQWVEAKTQRKVIAANVNGVSGANLVQRITYDAYYDFDGNLYSAEIHTVEFFYEGAELMRHNDRAAAGLGFGHLSDHAAGSYLTAGSGLYKDNQLWVDLYTKGTDNEGDKTTWKDAIEYETWDCEEELCDIIKSIKFDLDELGKTIKVNATSSFDLTLKMTVKPSLEGGADAAINATLSALDGANTLDTFNGEINYSGEYATSVDGSIAGEIISGGVDADEVVAAFDGDKATQASFENNFNNEVGNWMGLYCEDAVVPSEFRLAAASYNQQSKISGSYIQASNDGINWITLFNFRNTDEDPASWKDWASPAEGGTWTEGTYKVVTVVETEAYHYFRYFNYNDYGANRLSEFQLFGDPIESEPETNEPETNEPESNEPESNEPESNEPESNEPETNAPVVNVPSVEVADATWDCGCNIAFNGVRDLAMNIANSIVNSSAFVAWNPDKIQMGLQD